MAIPNGTLGAIFTVTLIYTSLIILFASAIDRSIRPTGTRWQPCAQPEVAHDDLPARVGKLEAELRTALHGEVQARTKRARRRSARVLT